MNKQRTVLQHQESKSETERARTKGQSTPVDDAKQPVLGGGLQKSDQQIPRQSRRWVDGGLSKPILATTPARPVEGSTSNWRRLADGAHRGRAGSDF